MSTQIKDGGPAFPQATPAIIKSYDAMGRPYLETRDYPAPSGMTLRDWFAGQALAASTLHTLAISRAASEEHELRPMANEDDSGTPAFDAKFLASEAYAIADAMIAARGPKP